MKCWIISNSLGRRAGSLLAAVQTSKMRMWGRGTRSRPAHGATCAQGHPTQLPRFYVAERLRGQPVGWLVRLDPGESRHTKTLRLQEGAAVELCDGQGSVVVAEIAGLGREGALARTLGEAEQVPLRGWQWQVAVACGSLKGGRSDWLLEKSVELGASDFIPLVTQRSPVIGSSGGGGGGGKPGLPLPQPASKRKKLRGNGAAEREQGEGESWPDDSSEGGREGRWQRLATAALKQSLRAHAMRVHPPTDIQGLCSQIRAADVALVGAAGAALIHKVAARMQQEQHPPNPSDSMASAGAQQSAGTTHETRAEEDAAAAALKARDPPVQVQQHGGESRGEAGGSIPLQSHADATGLRHGLLIIGPEGDFTPAELQQLLHAGATSVGLGELRLRAETAAIALLAYVRLHFDGQ